MKNAALWTLPILLLPLSAEPGCKQRGIEDAVDDVFRDRSVILNGEGGSKLIVSPEMYGRIFDVRVGREDMVGFVCFPEIYEGERNDRFNNFGGMDRFWIGPEAGPFGLFFPPGAKMDLANWRVPKDLNRGGFKVLQSSPESVKMTRRMDLVNFSGTRFQVQVDREAGLILQDRMLRTFGLKESDVRPWVSYAGSFSDNILINTGPEAWKKEKGLLQIWILGQFTPGPRTVVMAPFKDGEGPEYRDVPYLGKIPADRLKLLANTVIFRTDGRAEYKFGMTQMRTAGLAGSFDFQRNLLVVVRFDVPPKPALYASSVWAKEQADPYSGDAFQAHNWDRTRTADQRFAFYEFETLSPAADLAPGESIRHRHETHCFQGEYWKLREIAQKILGVDLDEVRKAIFPDAKFIEKEGPPPPLPDEAGPTAPEVPRPELLPANPPPPPPSGR